MMQLIKYITIIFICNLALCDYDRLFDDLHSIDSVKKTNYPEIKVSATKSANTLNLYDEIFLSIKPYDTLELAGCFDSHGNNKVAINYPLLSAIYIEHSIAGKFDNIALNGDLCSRCTIKYPFKEVAIFFGCQYDMLLCAGLMNECVHLFSPICYLTWHPTWNIPYLPNKLWVTGGFDDRAWKLALKYDLWNNIIVGLGATKKAYNSTTFALTLDFCFEAGDIIFERNRSPFDLENIIEYEKADSFMHILADSFNISNVSNHIYQLAKTLDKSTVLAIDNGYFIVGQFAITDKILAQIDHITDKEFFEIAPLETYQIKTETIHVKKKPFLKFDLLPGINFANRLTINGSVSGFYKCLNYKISAHNEIYSFNDLMHDYALDELYISSYNNLGHNIFLKFTTGNFNRYYVGYLTELLYSKPATKYACGFRGAFLYERKTIFTHYPGMANAFLLLDGYYFDAPFGVRVTAGRFLDDNIGCKVRTLYYLPSGIGFGISTGLTTDYSIFSIIGNLALCLFVPLENFFESSTSCISVSFALFSGNNIQSLSCGGSDIYDKLVLYHNMLE